MPPIPIHLTSPMAPTTAAKPDGITPSTASSDSTNPNSNPQPTRTLPASVPATTTASTSFNPNPPAPQPGAFPVPRSTSTSTSTSEFPAAPQPGATPTPAQVTATHHVTETRYSGPPPQSYIPTPTSNEKQGRSTDTSSARGPVRTVNLGPVPVPSPFERGGTGDAITQPGYTQNQNQNGTTGAGEGGQEQGGGGGVGDAAWNMLSRAGEALKKGEEAAWRAVRNK